MIINIMVIVGFRMFRVSNLRLRAPGGLKGDGKANRRYQAQKVHVVYRM